MFVCTFESYVKTYLAGVVTPFILFFVFGVIYIAADSLRKK